MDIDKVLDKKPKTQKAQIDTIWTLLSNHVITELKLGKRERRFMMAGLALTLALQGVLIGLVALAL